MHHAPVREKEPYDEVVLDDVFGDDDDIDLGEDMEDIDVGDSIFSELDDFDDDERFAFNSSELSDDFDDDGFDDDDFDDFGDGFDDDDFDDFGDDEDDE